MKLFFYDEKGKVTENMTVTKNADLSRAIIAENAPTYAPKDGMIGKLYCENGKLNWHYYPIDNEAELTTEQTVYAMEQNYRKGVDEA